MVTVKVGVGVSVGANVAVGEITGVGGIVAVGVGSFENGLKAKLPPVNHITIIAIPINTNITARAATNIGKKGFFFA